MKAGKGKVVSIEYTLRDDQGEVIDTSEGREPLDYIHGAGNIIQGLENSLEGREAGESFTVSIPPEEAYGSRDDSLLHYVERRFLDVEGEIEVGMQFQAQAEHGTVILTVANVEGDSITLDQNHPLAGSTLYFEVEVVGVREATAEELEHGHPHGPEGCGH
ncbi:MAG: peptidylprolyl isomerase [bacterium]|nr:MAG: peptidylprolyl isomerase [bacterium]